jgi:hypothetical protein
MLLVARITINEMNNPTVAVVCIQEVHILFDLGRSAT